MSELSADDYVALCPECETPASHTVSLGFGIRYLCSNCDTSWQAGDRDTFAICEKPLGGSEAVCYTCRSDLEEGSS